MLLILEKLLSLHYHYEIQIPFSVAITRFGASVSMLCHSISLLRFQIIFRWRWLKLLKVGLANYPGRPGADAVISTGEKSHCLENRDFSLSLEMTGENWNDIINYFDCPKCGWDVLCDFVIFQKAHQSSSSRNIGGIIRPFPPLEGRPSRTKLPRAVGQSKRFSADPGTV